MLYLVQAAVFQERCYFVKTIEESIWFLDNTPKYQYLYLFIYQQLPRTIDIMSSFEI